MVNRVAELFGAQCKGSESFFVLELRSSITRVQVKEKANLCGSEDRERPVSKEVSPSYFDVVYLQGSDEPPASKKSGKHM